MPSRPTRPFQSLSLAAMLVPLAAGAQNLVAAQESVLPFRLDRASIGPIEESGAMLVFGRDLTTAAQRSLRIDGTSVTAGPGVPSDHVADVVPCGGARWLVEFGALPHAGTSIAIAGATPVWHRETANDARARCVAGQLLIGYRRGGELVTQVLTPALGPAQYVRVAPAGVEAAITWVAAATDEFMVVAHGADGVSLELIRIVAGAIAQRRNLVGSGRVALAVGTDRVFVATGAADGESATLQSFARVDLAPGRATVLSGGSGHAIEVDSLWPGPQGLVAIGFGEGWTALHTRHYQSSLRLWDPSSGAYGAVTDLGGGDGHAVAWLGETLIVVQGEHPVPGSGPYPRGVTPPVVRVEPARLRRFTVGPWQHGPTRAP